VLFVFTYQFLLTLYFSFLYEIDEKNFGDSKIEDYFENAIDYIYNLFEDTIDDDDDTVEIITRPSVPDRVIPIENGDEQEINEQDLQLFQRVRQRVNTENTIVVNKHLVIEKQKNELRDRIIKSMNDYRAQCRDINIEKYLEENGNDLYKSMVEKNTIELLRIKFEDALYCSKFFDVSQWWMRNQNRYPELAMGASIILGKPTHNAFQERVFSRGTYSDTKLRKRLKEENFEMSVMNSVNGKQIDDIYHMMQPSIMMKENERNEALKEFMQKRMNEVDLSKIDEEEDEKEEVDTEFESICSVEENELLSDDEEDDFDIFTNMQKMTLTNVNRVENSSDLSVTKD
jgi:hypothetical protein